MPKWVGCLEAYYFSNYNGDYFYSDENMVALAYIKPSGISSEARLAIDDKMTSCSKTPIIDHPSWGVILKKAISEPKIRLTANMKNS